MPNVIIQDLTAVINGTSRQWAGYDTVHVDTFIQTDSPIPLDSFYYVPNGSSVPNEVLALFKLAKLDMYPMQESTILQGTENIREIATSENLEGTIADASRLLLRSVMKKTSLTPVTGTSNCYIISYDYKLFPVEPNVFEFKVVLPFDGLTVNPSGNRIQATICAPIGSIINPIMTKGIDSNGNEIQESITSITSIPNIRKPIVSFEYQIDPEFTVQYNY